jgi:carboxyl-terminal processing protease
MKRTNLLNKTPLPYILVAIFAATFVAAVACGNGELATAPSAVVDRSAGKVTTTGDDSFPEVIPLDVPLEAPSEVAEELRIIWEAWAILTRDHVDRADLDPSMMSEAAIRGMLIALGDPHTNYVSPEAMAIDSNDIFQGEFEGIGAHVSANRNGIIIIVAPIAGGPAEAAGIRPGDQILGVDGESIEGLSVLEAVALIRGPKGSTVSLEVKHLGALDPVIIDIVRGVIPLTSVLVRSQPGDKFLHVRLTNFYPETVQELSDAISEAMGNGAKGLVLDVRDNPGGLLSSVVDIAELFLAEGLVLYQVDGAGKRTNWNVSGPGDFTDLPMVILANGFSASASEVLAGAMQDHQRALLIGESTFGKGSVNILRPLSNGGGMFITTSRWYTPLGRLIQDIGLEPDIEVTHTDPRKKDVEQLKRALTELENLVAASPVSAGV